jgi:hypothetical protein
VQRALGRDQERVQRLYLHAGSPPAGLDDPQLAAHDLAEPGAAGLAEALGAELLRDGRVFVADPQGSVILSYPVDVEQRELLRDLKRLISVSRAG